MNPGEAYDLALKNGPSKDLEEIISIDYYWSYCYAVDIIKGSFPAGEEVISKNGHFSMMYASKALKGPFPLGESAIAKAPYDSLEYAKEILKGPFPAGEEVISRSSRYSYRYARYALKGAFPKGECKIRDTSSTALDYQFRFNRDICSNYSISIFPAYALAYAIMIGSRFPLGEPSMKESPRIWKRYQEFLNGCI